MENSKYFIKGGLIVNEGKTEPLDLLVNNGFIEAILSPGSEVPSSGAYKLINATGKIVIPGVIDDQVHFREPGLTEKATIYTESKAAIAGGVTSFMEMPNTRPPALTMDLLNDKFDLAAQSSLANYSFYLGASNDNIDEIKNIDPKRVCGIKVFMGASTGNLLVDDDEALELIFRDSPVLIATHCEDDLTIRTNLDLYRKKYHDDIPFEEHPNIRSRKACFLSSSKAVQLARKYGSRLHILHLSTEDELTLFEAGSIDNKKITAEVCVHHLWFSEENYKTLGAKIKWNPAIKKASDRDALLKALLNDKLDVIATDHAPHTLEEKNNPYLSCPSGGPLVQHSLMVMMEFYYEKKISLEKIIEKMCHAPSKLFEIEKRGFIRKGYYADLVILSIEKSTRVTKENIHYKCGWSPFEGQEFHSSIDQVFVNGHLTYNYGVFDENRHGMELQFAR